VLLEEDASRLDTTMRSYHLAVGASPASDGGENWTSLLGADDAGPSGPLLSRTFAPGLAHVVDDLRDKAQAEWLPAAAKPGSAKDMLARSKQQRRELRELQNLVAGLLHSNTTGDGPGAPAQVDGAAEAPGIVTARDATVAGRVRWLRREANAGGAMLVGPRGSAGPAARGRELVVERVPSDTGGAQAAALLAAVEAEVLERRALALNGTDLAAAAADNTLGINGTVVKPAPGMSAAEGAEGVFGLVWLPGPGRARDRFAVGDAVTLVGFADPANRGSFRVAGYAPGGGGVVLVELAPEQSGEGRAGWAGAETNVAGAVLVRTSSAAPAPGTRPSPGLSEAEVVLGPAREGAALSVVAGARARAEAALLTGRAEGDEPVVEVRGPASMLGGALRPGDAVRLRQFRWAGNRGVFLVRAVVHGRGAADSDAGTAALQAASGVPDAAGLPRPDDVTIVLAETSLCRGGLVDWIVPEFASAGAALLVDVAPRAYGAAAALPFPVGPRAIAGPASEAAPLLVLGSFPAAAVAASAAHAVRTRGGAGSEGVSLLQSSGRRHADTADDAVTAAFGLDAERLRRRGRSWAARAGSQSLEPAGPADGPAADGPATEPAAPARPLVRLRASGRAAASRPWDWAPRLGVGRVALVWSPLDAMHVSRVAGGRPVAGVGWPRAWSSAPRAGAAGRPAAGDASPVRGAVVRLEGFASPGNAGSFALVGRVGEVLVLAELPPGAASVAALRQDNTTCAAPGLGDAVGADASAAWAGDVVFAQTLPWLASPREAGAAGAGDDGPAPALPEGVMPVPAMGRDGGGEMIVLQGSGLRRAMLRAARAARDIEELLTRSAAAAPGDAPGAGSGSGGDQDATGEEDDAAFARDGLHRVRADVEINGRACRRSAPLSASAVVCVTPPGIGRGLDVAVTVSPSLPPVMARSRPATAALRAATVTVEARASFSYYEGDDERARGVPRALERHYLLAGSRPVEAEVARAERTIAGERSAGCAFNCSSHGVCERSNSTAPGAALPWMHEACRCEPGWAGVYCHVPFLPCPGGSGEPILESGTGALADECSGHGACDSVRGRCRCASDVVDMGPEPPLRDPDEAEARAAALARLGIQVGPAVNSRGASSLPRRFARVPWIGASCDERHCPTLVEGTECSGHGRCDSPTGGCECSTERLGGAAGPVVRWYGAACDRRTCPRDADGKVCGGRGRCAEGDGTGGGGDGVCACAVGFSGPACDRDATAGGDGDGDGGGDGDSASSGAGGGGSGASRDDADAWKEWAEGDGASAMLAPPLARAAVPIGHVREQDEAPSLAGADLHPSSMERAAFMLFASATTRGAQGDTAVTRADMEEVFGSAGGTDADKAAKRAGKVLGAADADRDGALQADEFVAASRISRLRLGLVPAAFSWAASVSDADGDRSVTPADLALRQLWRDGTLGREASEAAAVAGPAVTRIFCSGEALVQPGSSVLAMGADLRPELAPGEVVLVTVAAPVVLSSAVGRTAVLTEPYTGPSGSGFQLLRMAPSVRLGERVRGFGRAGGGRADVLMVRPSACRGLLSSDSVLVRGGMLLRLDGSEDRSAPRSAVLPRPVVAPVLDCDAKTGRLTLQRVLPDLERAMRDPTVTEGGATGGATTARRAGVPTNASAPGADADAGAALGSPSPSASPAAPSPAASNPPNADRAPLTVAVDTPAGKGAFAAVVVVGLVIERLPRAPFAGVLEPTGLVVDAETGATTLRASSSLAFRVRRGDTLFLADPLGPAVVRSVGPGAVSLQRPVGLLAAGGPVVSGRILKLNHSATGLPPPGPVLPGDVVSLSGRRFPVLRCGAPSASSVLFLGASFDGPKDTAEALYRVVPLPSVLIPLPATADTTSAMSGPSVGGGVALATSHDVRGLVVPGHLVAVQGEPPRPVLAVQHWGIVLGPGAWENAGKGPASLADTAETGASPTAVELFLVPPADSSDRAADDAAARLAGALKGLNDLYTGKALGGDAAQTGFSVPHPPLAKELEALEGMTRRTIAGGDFAHNPYLGGVVRRAQLAHRHLDLGKDGSVTTAEYRSAVTKDADRGFVTVAAPLPYPELAAYARDPDNKRWCAVYPDGTGPGPKLCKRTRARPKLEEAVEEEPGDPSAMAADVAASMPGGGGAGGDGGAKEEDAEEARALSKRRRRGRLEAASMAQSEVSRAVSDSMGSSNGGGSSSSSSSSGGGGGGGGFPDPDTGGLPDKPEKDEPEDVYPAFFWWPSPFFWCPMDMPFAMVFCPTPIPQLNILLKMMIPGIIRPVIGEALSNFATAQDTMLTIVQGILKPADGTGPRGGPPGFLQLGAGAAGATHANLTAALDAARAGARAHARAALLQARARPRRAQSHAEVLGSGVRLAHIPRPVAAGAPPPARRPTESPPAAGASLLQARAGKHKGTLVPALKKQMTDAMAPQLLPDLLKPIVQTLHANVHDALLPQLTASLRPLLQRTLAKAIRRAVSRGVAAAIDAEVRGVLRGSLRPLAEGIFLSVTRSAAPALARSIVHATLRTAYGAASPEMDQACAACEKTGFYCGECARLSASYRGGIRVADAALARLGPHYAEHFATRGLELLHPDGFAKVVEETKADWPPLGQIGSRTNKDGIK